MLEPFFVRSSSYRLQTKTESLKPSVRHSLPFVPYRHDRVDRFRHQRYVHLEEHEVKDVSLLPTRVDISPQLRFFVRDDHVGAKEKRDAVPKAAKQEPKGVLAVAELSRSRSAVRESEPSEGRLLLIGRLSKAFTLNGRALKHDFPIDTNVDECIRSYQELLRHCILNRIACSLRYCLLLSVLHATGGIA